MRFKKIALGLMALIYLSCNKQDPNILWIISDDLSPDLGCYGNPDVNTPQLDALASEGIMFTKVYANAPICSSSRSSFITGAYPTTISSLPHRTIAKKPLPGKIKTIVNHLQSAGYFCTNANGFDLSKPGKTDYNFSNEIKYDGTHWKEAGNQPFFAQVQFKFPHRPFVQDKKYLINPDDIKSLPCYLDHPLIKSDWAAYLSDIQLLDNEIGKLMNSLETDGLAENTVVMFFGDHGRPHLRDKQFLYEAGLKVPLIVRWPKKLKPREDSQLVNLMDVAATTLKIAGTELPSHIDGQSFLDQEKRKYVYGFRGRAGDALDDIRSISNGDYKLIWNRQPNRPYMQLSSYKKLMYPAFSLYKYLDSIDELPAPYNKFMLKIRPEFEFYDLKNDPCEFNNLAGNIELLELQGNLKKTLVEKLEILEKNTIEETLKDVQIAKNNSLDFSKDKMAKIGLDLSSPLMKWINYWNKYYEIP